MTTWLQLSLQDASSPIMEELVFFHDFTLMVLCFIMTFVAVILFMCLNNKIIHQLLLSGQALECAWTLLPVIILVQIALPSLVLLYLMETPQDSLINVKVTGHQWYWSYSFGKDKEFDSIMTPSDQLSMNEFRLLDVDNRLPLPYSIPVHLLVTSSDVIHAWAVPSLGVKVDANPGRLNQTSLMGYRPGVYFGQCSEICGANHSFMPIVIEMMSPSTWAWVIANL
uniref:cytochrome c oxidase subunit II n=1 Tax=Lamproglena chinensis TaxID=342427 RepID=UPI00286B2BFC|nr:cytochrome c oxidase subunit II [Lamproglena chinensis]WKF18934.1 cytochrome c oxidase subunit 2 [Lamproglena chinensis]